jgi:hypothetical protein
MKIEVSNGELIDKLSILEVKSKMIKDEKKLKNIEKERSILSSHYIELLNSLNDSWRVKSVSDTYLDLIEINTKLWDIEDRIREKEIERSFSFEFVELARSVYYTNDKRAELKRKINEITESNLIEEKEYKDYKK